LIKGSFKISCAVFILVIICWFDNLEANFITSCSKDSYYFFIITEKEKLFDTSGVFNTLIPIKGYKTSKETWNARTKIHLRSSFYGLDKFKREVTSEKDGTFKTSGKNGEIPILFSVFAVKNLQEDGSV